MITLFSFGYWGWGNAAAELVRAVNAVEKSRGYKPPTFVDVRLRRTVRAEGFSGNAFASVAGEDRYEWIPGLGNSAIARSNKNGSSIEIKDKSCAGQLLDLAIEGDDDKRRVIYFCACEFPKNDGRCCHRVEVARLVLKEAARRRVKVKIVEWPGELPQKMNLEVEQKDIRKLRRNANRKRDRIPLRDAFPGAKLCGLPWGSQVTVTAGDDKVWALASRAAVHGGKWYLPVQSIHLEKPGRWAAESEKFRRDYGFDPRIK